MKDSFPEFYRVPEDEFKTVWDTCIFVFDANALLNLYRYSQKTCQDFLHILTDQKIHDRVWVPHQFAFEYQKNRLAVIGEQKRYYKRLIEKIEGLKDEFERHPFLKMKSVMQPVLDTIRKTAKNHPKWHQEDPIRDELTELFKGKVGTPLTDEEFKKLCEKGEERYKKKLPPGYLDSKKNGDEKFGDLVGWEQIIKFASTTKKPIIFVTNESDEDWWQIISGETVGARYELVKEMEDSAGVFFCMYSWWGFHREATKYLKRKTDREVTSEIKEVAEKISDAEIKDTRSVSSDETVAPSLVQQILSEDVGKSDSSQN